jgi:monoamine oxidase
MARTPLLRAIRRLARDHAAADRLGIPVADYRARRDEQAYSRTEFLKRTGAAGAAIAAAGPLGALTKVAEASRGGPRIAIVGGGIAGLTTALTLQDAGVGSTVYEASSARVGGRMHSDWSDFPGYWADGQTGELCGELIDTNHETIRDLAKRFRLSTVDLLKAQPKGSDDTPYFFGRYYTMEQADRDFGPVYKAIHKDVTAADYPTTFDTSTPAGVALDKLTVYDWIESRVPGGHGSAFGELLDVAYLTEYGAETREQSSLNLIYLLGFSGRELSIFGESDERFHIVGGNAKLPFAIRDELVGEQGSDAVRMGWRMRSVARLHGGDVELEFDTPGGRETVRADHAVLCLSFTVLRTLDYSRAGFDDLKQKSIAKIGDGSNSKLALQFTKRLWNTNGPWGLSTGGSYADTGYQITYDVSRGQPGASGILVDYTGGDYAETLHASSPYATAASSQVRTFARRFLDQIEPVYPGIRSLWNGKATLANPMHDPNLLLSYSYWKPGQYHTLNGYPGVRQGNIHFAGEHCSVDFQGYMEGGAAEGVRAGEEILEDLGRL